MNKNDLWAAGPRPASGWACRAAAFGLIAIAGLLPAYVGAQSHGAMAAPVSAGEKKPATTQARCSERPDYPGQMWCSARLGEVIVILEPGTRASSGARLWSESPNITVADGGFVLTPYTGWGLLDPDSDAPPTVGPAYVSVQDSGGARITKYWFTYADYAK